MTGETDLLKMLANLGVERRAGEFAIISGHDISADKSIAIIEEAEGTTLVVPAAEAPGEPRWAWLTLTVHSSLHAVGLTAAFSEALAHADLPCNVIAGFHHDHILVPADRAEDAIQALQGLRRCS